MNLTDDEILKFQKGTPVFLDDICAVYSVTIGEIVDLGYSKFQQYLSIITATKPLLKADNEFTKAISKLSDFEYILMMTYMDQKTNEVLKEAFKFFTHQVVTFSLEPAQIVLGPLEEKHILNEEKFYQLQSLIKRAYFMELQGEQIIIHKDDSPSIKRLKMQMRENREKVHKAKAKEAARKGTDLQFSDLIGSFTINHCNINAVDVYKMTYYMFHDQLKRMGWRDEYNINSRAALAGAKLNKSQLKYWMRSINN